MSEAPGRRSSLSEVFELEESRSEQAIDLLVLAFERDPAYRYFCDAKRSGYRRRLDIVFRSGRALQRSSDQPLLGIRSGQRLAGLAMIQEPGARVSVWTQLRWLLKIAMFTGPRVPWRILGDVRIAERARPAEPHFYLPILAVHPDFQGSGCGRALLEALQSRSGRHPSSEGVCLETENPKNVPFYEHIGYRVIARNSHADLEIITLFRSDEDG
jgi:ribosomal protein S18 acetylase RimI-like enzyme